MDGRRLAAVTMTMAAALGGCGGADAGERVTSAVQTTLDAGSANFVLDQQIAGGDLTSDQRILVEGTADLEAGLTHSVTEAQALGVTDGTIETVEDGSTVFLRVTDGSAPTPWVRVTLGETVLTPQLEQLFLLSSADPRKSLTSLLGVTETEQVGQEEVRGAMTTHYRATADLVRAVDQAGEEEGALLRGWIEQTGVVELPVDIWLDDQGRVVRQSFGLELDAVTLPGEELAGELEGEATTTIEYFDFGAADDVRAPPDDQVSEYAER